MKVLSFVNGGTSTSFQLEVSAKINQITDADVEIASFYDDSSDDLDADVQQLEVPIHTLGGNSRFDIQAYRRLRSLLSDFDIFHTHYNAVGSVGRIAALGTDTKVINTEHNDHRHFSTLQNVTNCITYPIIDRMILNSQSTLDSLQWYERPFLYRSECEIIYNGIDFNRIDAALERTDIPDVPDGPKVVTASTITEQKNLHTLIKAMEFVTREIPNANLIVIGDGPLREDVQKTAERIGVDDSVVFLGFLPEREQVYGTLQKCDIFAVPSIYEGFCNAAVEAMGCGLPVVASDIDVLREVINNSGRFADPSDPNEFAQEIVRLLSDDQLLNQLSNTSKDYSRDRFPIERSAMRYYKMYSDMI